MGLPDKLKQMTDKARLSAVEHREQISNAVETASVVADKRTRGRYSDRIANATSKTKAAVDRFAGQVDNADTDTADGAVAPAPGQAAAPPVPGQPAAAEDGRGSAG